jgi:hypothetical protein
MLGWASLKEEGEVEREAGMEGEGLEMGRNAPRYTAPLFTNART